MRSTAAAQGMLVAQPSGVLPAGLGQSRQQPAQGPPPGAGAITPMGSAAVVQVGQVVQPPPQTQNPAEPRPGQHPALQHAAQAPGAQPTPAGQALAAGQAAVQAPPAGAAPPTAPAAAATAEAGTVQVCVHIALEASSVFYKEVW